MTDLLDAVDKLNHAKHLFVAVEMAVADIRDPREQNALGALLLDAIDCLQQAIDGVEGVRLALRHALSAASASGR